MINKYYALALWEGSTFQIEEIVRDEETGLEDDSYYWIDRSGQLDLCFEGTEERPNVGPYDSWIILYDNKKEAEIAKKAIHFYRENLKERL